MNERIHYSQCPACDSTEIKKVLEATDFTVSKELFAIFECANCTLRFTQDVPGPGAIAPYYKSEDYISHTNTAKGFVNKVYHWVRKRTLAKKRKLVNAATGLRKGKLLDVGSGVGSFAFEMKQHGWDVTGVEPDPDARKVAETQYGLNLLDPSGFDQLVPGSYDAITLWHVLEHVHDLQSYVSSLKKLLTVNGKLCVAVPNYTSLDASIYKEFWAAYDVPRHLYHFSPRSMSMLMEKSGLKVERKLPMWYDSIYISLLSSKYKTGKTGWTGAITNGLHSNARALSNTEHCSSVTYIISRENATG